MVNIIIAVVPLAAPVRLTAGGACSGTCKVSI